MREVPAMAQRSARDFASAMMHSQPARRPPACRPALKAIAEPLRKGAPDLTICALRLERTPFSCVGGLPVANGNVPAAGE